MNHNEWKKIIRQNFIFYLIGFLVIFGFKYLYSKAGSDELIWILAPTTHLVTILSGIPFAYESDIGYVNHELRFIIAPSCSGVRFMLITAAVLIFSYVHRIGIPREGSNTSPSRVFYKKLGWIAASIGTSYLLTVLVNGMRIVLAIYLPLFFQEQNLYRGFLTPKRLHTIIGTVIYFTALLVIYHFAGDMTYKREPGCNSQQADGTDRNTSILRPLFYKYLPPVFWYLLIVLGVPLLHNAIRGSFENFKEFAILIIVICTAILCILLAYHQFMHSRIKNSHSNASEDRQP